MGSEMCIRDSLLTGYASLERWTSTCIEMLPPSVASAQLCAACDAVAYACSTTAVSGTHSDSASGPRQRSQSSGNNHSFSTVACVTSVTSWLWAAAAAAASAASQFRGGIAALRARRSQRCYASAARCSVSASPIHSYARAPLSAVAALFWTAPSAHASLAMRVVARPLAAESANINQLLRCRLVARNACLQKLGRPSELASCKTLGIPRSFRMSALMPALGQHRKLP